MQHQKHQTVEDAFINNYEALKPWWDHKCVPYRLPHAVRYFIAQQLGQPERIRVQLDYQPQSLDIQALEFRDGSYLIAPDELFEDQSSYEKGLKMRELGRRLYNLQREIGELRNELYAHRALTKSSAILSALCRLGRHGGEDSEGPVEITIENLYRELAEYFWMGCSHVKNQKDFLSMAKKGEKYLGKLPKQFQPKMKSAITWWLGQELSRLQN